MQIQKSKSVAAPFIHTYHPVNWRRPKTAANQDENLCWLSIVSVALLWCVRQPHRQFHQHIDSSAVVSRSACLPFPWHQPPTLWFSHRWHTYRDHCNRNTNERWELFEIIAGKRRVLPHEALFVGDYFARCVQSWHYTARIQIHIDTGRC